MECEKVSVYQINLPERQFPLLFNFIFTVLKLGQCGMMKMGTVKDAIFVVWAGQATISASVCWFLTIVAMKVKENYCGMA